MITVILEPKVIDFVSSNWIDSKEIFRGIKFNSECEYQYKVEQFFIVQKFKDGLVREITTTVKICRIKKVENDSFMKNRI